MEKGIHMASHEPAQKVRNGNSKVGIQLSAGFLLTTTNGNATLAK